MEELQVRISQEPGRINFNFEELKTQLSAKMEEYRGAVFTEDSKTAAKAELANLRKLKEAVDKRRKEVKVQVMVPYAEFEGKVKELLSIIDGPIDLINRQVKEMEEQRIQKRRAGVKRLWEEIVNDRAEYLSLAEIHDKKWDNATTTLKSVEKDLRSIVEKTDSEIQIINSSQSEAADEALGLYKRTRDLTKALTHINVYEANKKKALAAEEERRKREEERRRLQEIERAKAEEREKLAEIERARKEERERLRAEAAVNVREDMPEESGFEPASAEQEELDELPFVQPDTKTVFYKVVASAQELEQVEMAFNSIGIYFERREA